MEHEGEKCRGAGRSAIRVLIVDDEAAFRESLRKLLVHRGMQVLTAASGPEGLAVLGAQPVAGVTALKHCAFDFLLKPMSIDHLVTVIESAAEAQRGEGRQ